MKNVIFDICQWVENANLPNYDADKCVYEMDMPFSKVNADLHTQIKLYLDLVHEELNETKEALTKEFNGTGNVKEATDVVDGFADVIFVGIGGLYLFLRSQGYESESAKASVIKALEIVTKSNYTKLVDGEFQYNEKGKVIKPSTFIPPDFTDLVKGY